MNGLFPTILFRRGRPEEWEMQDPILSEGEPGLEKGTGKFKIGNGISTWSRLPYYLDELGIEVLISSLFNDSDAEDLAIRIGDLNNLSTTDRDSIVDAINEVNCAPIPFVLLYQNAKAG